MGALRGIGGARAGRRACAPAPAASRFTFLLAACAALVFLFPFGWMLSTALKPGSLVFADPPVWLTWPPAWHNFVEAWQSADFGRFTLNSLWVAGLTTVGTVLSSSLVGFAFATLPARGKRVWFGLLLATLMVPAWTTLIPSFLLFSRLGFTDSYVPLIVPAFCAPAIYVFLFRQAFRAMPTQLFDAAEVDGANPLLTYWYIALPMARPAAATVAVFAFIGAWSDFLNPLIYLRSMEKFTLALGLSFLSGPNFIRLHWQMAMSVVALLPVIMLVFLTQRHFMRDMTIWGINP